jgi:predicted nucleic acid-binding protein
MIILDTNVASVPFQLLPNAKVMDWLDVQIESSLYLTTITASEMFAGVAKLPLGRKREHLAKVVSILFELRFRGRILDFDLVAAKTYGTVFEALRRKGHNGKPQDAMIAAIALAHGFAVATRDELPFQLAGVDTINPWNA